MKLNNTTKLVFSIILLASLPLSFSQELSPKKALPKSPAAESELKDSSSAQKISLDVKGMDVVDVLKILADQGNLSLSISGNVKGRVTLFLKEIDIWDVLDIVVVSSDLAYDTRGEIIYVMTEKDYELKYGKRYWDQRKMEVFDLTYAKATKVGSILSQIASKIGKVVVEEATNNVIVVDIPETVIQMRSIVRKLDKPTQIRVFDLDYITAAKIGENINPMLSQEVGVLKIDEVSNKVMVTDYPDKIKDIEKMVTAFDEKPLQVLIDSKIIEIKPDKKFYSGVDWDYWIRTYFRVQGTLTIPVPSGSNPASFGTVGTGTPSESGQYKGILDFLDIFGTTDVLASPRILALNNQEAKILVGTKEVYITSSTSQAGESTVTSQSVNFVDVGVKLYVTPTINRAGYITLKIRPEISSAQSEDITSEGQISEIPVVTTSEAETTVLVKDGVDIIIGGLKKITHEKEIKQVPILGSIPFFGVFFRSEKNELSKSELVIVLTPHIISGDKGIEVELGEKREEGIGRASGESDVLRLFDQKKADVVEKVKKPKKKKPKPEKISKKKAPPEQPKPTVLFKPPQVKKEERPLPVLPVKESQIVKPEIKEVKAAKPKPIAKPQPVKPAKEVKKAEIPKRNIFNPTAKPKPAKNDYYQEVVERISEVISSYPSSKDLGPGEVKVSFTISKQGYLLKGPEVVSSQGAEDLNFRAKEIIRYAAPFPPFPVSKDQDQETFQIRLVFD